MQYSEPSDRILIVDDEAVNVQLLEGILDRGGFCNFKSTTDPRTVQKLVAEIEPDLILLDLTMPHLDGFALMKQIRAGMARETYLPILVLTAMAAPEIKRRALAEGATDFLAKPFDTQEVLLRVQNLLDTRRLHAALQRQAATLEDTVNERTHELAKALAELRDTQQHLIQQERMRALGVMAGGVAHDLNNALSVILGFGEMVLSDCQRRPGMEDQTEPLGAIITAAEDAAQMVTRLREFNRPPHDEIRQQIDLKALARQAVTLTEPRWKTQALGGGIHIDVRLDCKPAPPVLGDPAELREALTNLIFNAVDAMPEGGTIWVRSRPSGKEVVLEVSDTGTGMTEDVRQRCLEPFFTTKGENGTGLGLAMVYGIFQRHGSRIEIESSPGAGTTFRFYLAAACEEQTNSTRPVARMPEAPLHILVAEDQEVLRDIVKHYLEHDWHTVETAENGVEALAKFQSGSFDLVITDQMMPEMNGNQLIPAIKNIAPEQPILMMTGFGSGDISAASPLADMVLTKPVAQEALRRAVAQLTSKRQTA